MPQCALRGPHIKSRYQTSCVPFLGGASITVFKKDVKIQVNPLPPETEKLHHMESQETGSPQEGLFLQQQAPPGFG